MSTLVEVLHHEHDDFAQEIDQLHRLADDCLDERPAAVLADLDAAIVFLVDELLPHTRVEEGVLAVLLVATDRLGLAVAQRKARGGLPPFLEPANLFELGGIALLREEAEQPAGFDRAELRGITN